MGNFKGKGGFGGPKGGDRGGDRFEKRDFNKRRFEDNRDMGRRDFGGKSDMHDATCADCGRPCQVPFRPTGDKPVYCKDCFGKHKGDTGGRFEKNDFKKDFGGPRRDFDRKPEGRPHDHSGDIRDLKRKVDELHAKLDTVMSMMGSQKPASTSFVPDKIKKEVTAKKTKMDGKAKAAPKAKAVKKAPAKKKK